MRNYISEFKLYEIFRILMPGTYSVVMLLSIFDCNMYKGNDVLLFSIMMFIISIFLGSIFYAADLCRFYNIATTWKWLSKHTHLLKLKFLPSNMMRNLLPGYNNISQRELEHKYYNWYHFSDTKTRTELQSGLYHLFTNFLFASSIILLINWYLKNFREEFWFNIIVALLSILGVILIYQMRLKHSWQRNFAQYVEDEHPDLKYDFYTNKVITKGIIMSNNLNGFTDKILKEFTLNITDRVFIMIENDKKLLLEYLQWVSDDGLDKVNQTIGLRIKEYYDLENIEEENKPISKLIKSYTQHKTKE